MKERKRITQFMLELYHLDALTYKERKLIEKALAADNEVYMRYDELKRIDTEIKIKYSLSEQKVFNLNKESIFYKSRNLITKKSLIGIGIAAAIFFLGIPAFIYLSSDRDSKVDIAATDTDQIGAIEEEQSLVILDAEDQLIIITDKEKHSIKTEENRRSIEIERIVALPNDDKKEEVRTEENLNIIEPLPVIIAELPNNEQKVLTRGGSGTNDQSITNNQVSDESYREQGNVNIPPGLSFIFDNMFANGEHRVVIIPNRIRRIGKNAFANNPIVSVTIGADVVLEDDAIPGNFAYVYNNYGKAAGTYERLNITSNEWSKK